MLYILTEMASQIASLTTICIMLQVRVVEKYTPEKLTQASPSRKLIFGLHSPAIKDEIRPAFEVKILI